MSTVLASPTPLLEAVDLLAGARLLALTGQLDRLWVPATCPAALLPYLAASLGALVWPKQATLAQRRAWVAEAELLAARAGTAWAVRRALALCGLPVTAVERSGPKAYRVVLSSAPTGQQMALLTALCAAYAPLTARRSAVDVATWELVDGNLDDGVLDGGDALMWAVDGDATGAVAVVGEEEAGLAGLESAWSAAEIEV